jgi:hypothetical protein
MKKSGPSCNMNAVSPVAHVVVEGHIKVVGEDKAALE